MSYNLYYNGKVTQPIISTDSFLYSKDFTINQQNDFYRSCGPYTAIQNWNTGFAFPETILINKNSFFSIHYTNYRQQLFTVILPGSYRLSFYYAGRSCYFLNNLQI